MMYEAFVLDSKHEVDEPDRTHLIVALDLLSGLTQALSTDIQPFFANSDPSCIDLMIACFKVSEQVFCRRKVYILTLPFSIPSLLCNSPHTRYLATLLFPASHFFNLAFLK